MRLLVVLGWAAVTLGAAASVAPKEFGPAPGLVELRLLIDESMPVTVRVRAGEQATIRAEGKGSVGLVPLVRNATLELRVIKVTVEGADGATVTLGTYRLERGEVSQIQAGEFALAIEWAEYTPSGSDTDIAAPCRECCIVCDGREVCGCAVETSCGRCCCPDYCQCFSNGAR